MREHESGAKRHLRAGEPEQKSAPLCRISPGWYRFPTAP